MSTYMHKLQPKRAKSFCSEFIRALASARLYVSLFLESDLKSVEETNPNHVFTWASPDISDDEQDQWQKVGYKETTAVEIIINKFDHTIALLMLALPALVIIGYCFFVLRISERHYFQVIDETISVANSLSKRTVTL